MDELFHKSQNGLQGYIDAITVWIEERQNVDSDERKRFFRSCLKNTCSCDLRGSWNGKDLFDKSCITIYGFSF